MSDRTAKIIRNTNETQIDLTLALDGTGAAQIETGVGFFDHMLHHIAHHGLFDLSVQASGDRHIDAHHTVEDVAICLGRALDQALGDRRGIARMGYAYVPMDEALARAVIDLSGRFYLQMTADFAREQVGDLSTEMVRHFWYSFAEHARCNLHIDVLRGQNAHHIIEAIFKATARALRSAVRRDPAQAKMPSTKGSL